METGTERAGNRPPRGASPKPYRPTWMDRYGADGVFQLPILALAGLGVVGSIGALVSWLAGAFRMVWIVLPAMALVAAAIGAVAYRITSGIARGISQIAFANGASARYDSQYSLEDAMAMRGDVAGALASFEERIAATPIDAPTGIEVRIRAAEMYARPKGDPARAAELFRDVQRLRDLSPNRDLYVSNRLIDLYLGPLHDEGRALVELRRLIERYPETDFAAGARAAIARMKTG